MLLPAMAIALMPALAAAQSPCAARAAVLAFHAERFGEVPVARGLAAAASLGPAQGAAGCVVELLAAGDGNWSIVMTCAGRPGGPGGPGGARAAGHLTCLVATGEGWEAVAPAPANPGRGT
jgi:hypothetical protein